MARIAIIVGSHLCRNPRAVRAADALALAGHDVTVLGPIFSQRHAEEDDEILRKADWQYNNSIDLRSSHSSRLQNLVLRGKRRVGRTAVQYFGIQTPQALGYGMLMTLQQADALNADLYIGHQEIGAWVCTQLGQRGRKVAADFEDWYSRDLLAEAQRTRPIRLLQRCESFLLQHASFVSTTSHAMSRALQDCYGGNTATVVYNTFSWADRVNIDGRQLDRQPDDNVSLHWVSQTIGPGRGLESVCESLQYVNIPIDLHLRGECDPLTNANLRGLFPQNGGHRLYIHPPVRNRELLSRIAEHDIGLAFELSQPDSRNLTITYKAFHYLVAGLPIIATKTAGQIELAEKVALAVQLCESDSVTSIASQITALASDKAALRESKAAALLAAHNWACWEKQSPSFVSSVAKALEE